MSDCSSEAMKPKERSEVCPNCEHPMVEHISEYEPSLIHFNCLNCGCSIMRAIKERPRTCETCDRYYNVRPFMRQGACTLDDLDENGCAPIHNADDEACGRWLEVELPLEQRFQQLEQVAKEACITLNNYVDSFSHKPWACSNHLFSLVKDFKEDLEALGVDINAGM